MQWQPSKSRGEETMLAYFWFKNRNNSMTFASIPRSGIASSCQCSPLPKVDSWTNFRFCQPLSGRNFGKNLDNTFGLAMITSLLASYNCMIHFKDRSILLWSSLQWQWLQQCWQDVLHWDSSWVLQCHSGNTSTGALDLLTTPWFLIVDFSLVHRICSTSGNNICKICW